MCTNKATYVQQPREAGGYDLRPQAATVTRCIASDTALYAMKGEERQQEAVKDSIQQRGYWTEHYFF